MILNTWVVEISFDELYLAEKMAVLKALKDILGSELSSKLFKWNIIENLFIASRPEGTVK